ncbi:MAG: DUF1934 domain-containing protein [Oscillospiraceae bacterium]|nr:DUF1934 domain-containing protein [Oscillospiraceae bacterium]
MIILKENWIMTLRNVQYEEEDKIEIVLNTVINYMCLSTGVKIIVYFESEATGMEGSTTRMQVSPDDNIITIIRQGSFNSNLVIQEGRKHFCNYKTPFGELTFGISAKYIDNNLTDEGGTLKFRYTIDSNSSLLSDNEIFIEIKKNV